MIVLHKGLIVFFQEKILFLSCRSNPDRSESLRGDIRAIERMIAMKNVITADAMVILLVTSVSPALSRSRLQPAGKISVEVVVDRGDTLLSIRHGDF